jgi:hypothetical protein
MDFSLLQENKIFMSSISAVGGIFISLITQQILKKRGVLSYQVNHNRIGFSTDDVVFGSVRVTWNGTEASNLYFSTIEIKNESTLDFENIVIRAYSTDTNLLTEQTQLIGTSHILEWSEKFKEKIHIADGNVATQPQKDLHSSQREYNIPALNRGQTIRLNYLNSPKNTNSPNIWLDVIHKGVKLIYRPQDASGPRWDGSWIRSVWPPCGDN